METNLPQYDRYEPSYLNDEDLSSLQQQEQQTPQQSSTQQIVDEEELLAAQAASAVAAQQSQQQPGGAFSNVGQGLSGKYRNMMMQYWQETINSIEHDEHDFKNHQLPLARIKKVMKTDEEVRMISAEAPILFAKGCDIFITELTMRAWIHAEENKRRTLQKSDIAAALQKSDMFDFLIDIVPREEEKPKNKTVNLTQSRSNSYLNHMTQPQPVSQQPQPSQSELSQVTHPDHQQTQQSEYQRSLQQQYLQQQLLNQQQSSYTQMKLEETEQYQTQPQSQQTQAPPPQQRIPPIVNQSHSNSSVSTPIHINNNQAPHSQQQTPINGLATQVEYDLSGDNRDEDDNFQNFQNFNQELNVYDGEF